MIKRQTIWIFLIALSLIPLPTQAQENENPVFLIAGVDTNGLGYPLAQVDLAGETVNTLATFASGPVCPPTIFPDGQAFLYELANPANPAYVYHVDANSGARTQLVIEDRILNCPTVSPDGTSIAWIETHFESERSELPNNQTLVITDANGQIIDEPANHYRIFDVVWSPGGGALIYNVTTNATPYPTLYSVPIDGASEPRIFWDQTQGLISEYEWTADGTGLLVSYETDEYVAIKMLTLECVIADINCDIQPMVTFIGDDAPDLLGAYSPLDRLTVVSVQTPNPTTSDTQTELWILHLTGDIPPRQLTRQPDLLKTDAYWSENNQQIYFIGSRFEPDIGQWRGGIYSIPVNGSAPATLRFESDLFSPSAILWAYE